MRHGTLTMATTGGCSEDCCAPVARRYYKRYAMLKARGHRFTVPAEPSVRKIQALQRLGHTRGAIAAAAGMSKQAFSNMLAHDIIKARTAARIDEAYRALEMTVPEETPWTRRARREAEEAGWPPPLAYEDIETGVLAPDPTRKEFYRARLDEELIEYVLQYQDFTPRLTRGEKCEIVRRWRRSGRSERSLCQLTGWRPGRYAQTTTTTGEDHDR